MAKKVTQLTELTAPDDADQFVIVDTEVGSTKRISRGNMLNNAIGPAELESNAVTTVKIADKNVTSRKAALTIVGADGTSLNPIPTTRSDVANSSVTFSCDVASYIFMIVSARIQTNTNMAADVVPFLDGSTMGRALGQELGGTTMVVATNSRVYSAALTTGAHTIKLTSQASTAGAAVAHDPSWWGILIAQP